MDRAVDREPSLFPHEPERPHPADPQRLDPRLPAPRGGEREGADQRFAGSGTAHVVCKPPACGKPLVEREREYGALREAAPTRGQRQVESRSEEQPSELQSLMPNPYAVVG